MNTISLLGSVVFLLSQVAFCESMFRGGPDHTGVYQATGLRQTPAVKWRFQTGGRKL